MRHIAIPCALRGVRSGQDARMTEMRDDHAQDALRASGGLDPNSGTQDRTIARHGPVLALPEGVETVESQDRAAGPGRARRHRATGQVGYSRLGSQARAEAHMNPDRA